MPRAAPRAYPELNLQKINVITQYDGNIGLESKNFRLDVWAQDYKGRIYDIEMQTTNKQNACSITLRG